MFRDGSANTLADVYKTHRLGAGTINSILSAADRNSLTAFLNALDGKATPMSSEADKFRGLPQATRDTPPPVPGQPGSAGTLTQTPIQRAHRMPVRPFLLQQTAPDTVSGITFATRWPPSSRNRWPHECRSPAHEATPQRTNTAG